MSRKILIKTFFTLEITGKNMSITKVIRAGNNFQFSPTFFHGFVQTFDYQLKMRNVFGNDEAILSRVFLQPDVRHPANQRVVLQESRRRGQICSAALMQLPDDACRRNPIVFGRYQQSFVFFVVKAQGVKRLFSPLADFRGGEFVVNDKREKRVLKIFGLRFFTMRAVDVRVKDGKPAREAAFAHSSPLINSIESRPISFFRSASVILLIFFRYSFSLNSVETTVLPPFTPDLRPFFVVSVVLSMRFIFYLALIKNFLFILTDFTALSKF